jgi:G:T/U-mismatch repair DNA glycosylase
MKKETHPFNDSIGLATINENTKKLILGTFPAFQVTSNKSPRLNFYYGSTDNKFWDIIHDVLEIKSELTAENIVNYLSDNNFGIIDIIRKCYRKDNNSSADEDLTIIEFQDIIEILSNSKIDTIYTTSELVTKLLKQQIEPLLDKKSSTEYGKKKKKNEIFIPLKLNDFEYVKVDLPANVFVNARQLCIKTLYSPSDQGIRGITKGINSKNLKIDAVSYRREQYKQLLKSY